MSNQPFADFLRQDQRLVLLRILSELPQYRSNSSVLASLLGEYGHHPSRDQVKTDLVWLGEQGLVRVEDIGSVLVVTLTERGDDVAAGRASVPGVSKPRA
ncbi:TPA: ArsR family transcriptional regulator [Pseudomonas aeruginosa]|nr:ArsR family transcriptional regulator [Pseudomonas aeruginosa]